jgi:hypothetical protein
MKGLMVVVARWPSRRFAVADVRFHDPQRAITSQKSGSEASHLMPERD